MRLELIRARVQEKAAKDAYVEFQAKLDFDTFQKLVNLDPQTVGDNVGPASAWIARKYIKLPPESKDRFFAEDAEAVKEGLTVFYKLSKNNEGVAKLTRTLGDDKPANPKDINGYSVGQIRKLASLLHSEDADKLGTKEEKQVKILVNDSAMLALIPETHAAARKYGTGTSWCTATSNDYYFKSYSEEGPLIIIIDKQAPTNRWQYHNASKQFMDPSDSAVSVHKVAKYWLRKDEAHNEAFDKLAQLLETQFKYNEWSYEQISQSFKKSLMSLSKTLQGISPSQYNRYRTKDGSSIIGYCLQKDFLDAADYFVKNYKVKPVPTDLARAILAENMTSIRYLLGLDSSLLGRMMEVTLDTSIKGPSIYGIASACINNENIMQLLLSRIKDVPLALKAEYFFDESNPFFGSRFIRDLVSKKGIKADAFLLTTLTELFGDYSQIQEARTLDIPSFDSVFKPSENKTLKEKIRLLLNKAIGPYEEFFPTTHRWLGRTDINPDVNQVLNIDSIVARIIAGDSRASKLYDIWEDMQSQQQERNQGEDPRTLRQRAIIKYLLSNKNDPAKLEQVLVATTEADLHGLDDMVSYCLSQSDKIVVEDRSSANAFMRGLADEAKLFPPGEAKPVGDALMSVIQQKYVPVATKMYECFLTRRDIFLEAFKTYVAYISLKGAKAVTSSTTKVAELKTALQPFDDAYAQTKMNISKEWAEALKLVDEISNHFDPVFAGTKALIGYEEWGYSSFAIPIPAGVDLKREKTQAKTFAEILSTVDPANKALLTRSRSSTVATLFAAALIGRPVATAFRGSKFDISLANPRADNSSRGSSLSRGTVELMCSTFFGQDD